MDGEKKKLKFSIGYLIIAFWAVLLLQQVFSAYLQPTRMSYSDFKAAVSAGRVTDVAIGRAVIRGHMKTESSGGRGEEPRGASRGRTRRTLAGTRQEPATHAGPAGPGQRKAPPSPQQLQREAAARGNSFESVRVDDSDLMRDLLQPSASR